MATNCSQNLYTINFTDTNKDEIFVSKGELITDKADIAFVGKTKRDYGEIFNENVLHLLEHFACPEDPLDPGNPDLASAFGALLENPIEGQIWYNVDQKRPFRYNGTIWEAMGMACDIAGNYGVIAHGEQLPQPVCPVTGYVFQYEECSWIVSPFNYPSDINFMRCFTDDNALVTMEYRPIGSTLTTGLVNYQIVGIKDNSNLGTLLPEPSQPVAATPTPTLTPTLTATVTPTMTVTPGVSADVTPTVTATVTPTNTVTPSNTPAPGSSLTPTPTPEPTPSSTPASTPPATPGPTQSSTPTVTPSNTPDVTPSSTPDVTPSSTPAVTPTPSPDYTGDVISQTVSCGNPDPGGTTCISINSAGFISAIVCGINTPWVKNGFRPGESGADYSFTAVKSGPPFASGPTSGTFASTQSWCLEAPIAGDWDTTVTVSITGPPGTASGTIVLNLSAQAETP